MISRISMWNAGFSGLVAVVLSFANPAPRDIAPLVEDEQSPSIMHTPRTIEVPAAVELPAPTRTHAAREDRIFDGPVTLYDAMEKRLEIQARRDARVGEGENKNQFVTSADVFEHPKQYRAHVRRSRRRPTPPVIWSVRWDRMGKPAPYDGYETPGLPERTGEPKPVSLSEALSGLAEIQSRRNARTARDTQKQRYCTLIME